MVVVVTQHPLKPAGMPKECLKFCYHKILIRKPSTFLLSIRNLTSVKNTCRRAIRMPAPFLVFFLQPQAPTCAILSSISMASLNWASTSWDLFDDLSLGEDGYEASIRRRPQEYGVDEATDATFWSTKNSCKDEVRNGSRLTGLPKWL
jgi:hypothetical protein